MRHCSIMGVQPGHILDYLLWPLLQRTWEKWSKKRSHWWHWRSFAGEVVAPLFVRADITATKSVFWGSNFHWQEVVILQPLPEHAHRYYQVGFRSGGVTQLCSLVVDGPVAMLLGPRTVEFFAVTRYKQPVCLVLCRITKRRDLDPAIPLL